jgi:hypothetical protein
MKRVSAFLLVWTALIAHPQEVPYEDKGFTFEDFAPGQPNTLVTSSR